MENGKTILTSLALSMLIFNQSIAQNETVNGVLTVNTSGANTIRVENDVAGEEATIRLRSKPSNGTGWLHSDISSYATGSNTGFLGFKVPHDSTFEAGFDMIVDHSGNVGIGTTDPNATLQVGDSQHSGSPGSEVEVRRLSLAPVTHSGSDWFFTTRDNNPYANLDIGYSDRKTLTLRHDGNVGIGTTDPDSRLTVVGKVHAQEVKVTVDAGADFVFSEDYDLPPLTSLEQFIRENEHLPEIASAAEMEENGIHLAEMNIKLLQKIEELTLYLIEKDKQLSILDSQLKAQNSRSRSLEEENRMLKGTLDEIIGRLERLEQP